MSLWWRLLRSHWRTLFLAGGAGIVGGLSSAGLLAFINTALQSEGPGLSVMAWAFAGLCLAAVIPIDVELATRETLERPALMGLIVEQRRQLGERRAAMERQAARIEE